jgi:iron complex transport system permease protein
MPRAALGPRPLPAVLLLAAAAGVAAVVDLLVGPAGIPPGRVLAALAGEAPAADRVIILDLRLPVALMAVAVGAALGAAGALMQTTLDNPLASPFTMGLSAAAGVGATSAMLLTDAGWFGPSLAGAAAPAGALVATVLAAMLIDAVGRWRGMTREVMVLAGIAVMFFCQSLQALIQLAASPDSLARIVGWFLGDLHRAGWNQVAIVALATVLAALLIARDAWRLTALRLGEGRAAALGVDVSGVKRRALAAVAVLTAAAVCFVGSIGFIGLVAPHLARAVVGEDHRWLVPASALAGAALLGAASAAAKVIVPGVALPVTVVTALVGVPFLLLLIARAGRAAA